MLYVKKPKDFNPKYVTAGCFIQNADEFLLLQRQAEISHGLKWGVPAGRREVGESLKKTMCREIHEETGIVVQQDELYPISTVWVVDPNGVGIEFHMYNLFLSHRPEVRLAPAEHTAHRWVSPTAALEMDLIHDMEPCIKMTYVC